MSDNRPHFAMRRSVCVVVALAFLAVDSLSLSRVDAVREMPAPDLEPSDPLTATVFAEFVNGLGLGLTQSEIADWSKANLETLQAQFAARSMDLPVSLERVRSGQSEVLRLSLTPIETERVLSELLAQPNLGGGRAEFLSERFGLDPSAAAEWSERSLRLERWALATRYQFVNSWAGAIFDHKHQSLEISTTSSTDAAAILKEADGLIGVNVRLVAVTEQQIADAVVVAHGEITRLLQPVAGEMIKADSDVRIYDDFPNNGIIVAIDERIDSDLVELIKKSVPEVVAPVPVSFEVRRVEPIVETSCRTPIECGPVLRGNTRLAAGNYTCTSGLIFVNLSNPSDLKGSTAGHCENSVPWTQVADGVTVTIGATAYDSLPTDNIDVQLFNINNRTFWYPQGSVMTGPDDNSPISGTVSQAGAVIGALICKGGTTTFQNSGFVDTCGQLLHKYESSFENHDNLGVHDNCISDLGDSGAAVYGNAYHPLAYGIHKGFSATWCFFSWASDVTELWGYTPLVAPAQRRGDFALLSTPVREVDSRQPFGIPGPLAGGAQTSFSVGGWASAAPYAALGIEAVVVNVTVVSPSAAGYLTVWDWDGTKPANNQPATSTTNFATNQTRATTAVVPLGPTGRIGISASVTTHVLIDVTGFVVRPSSGSEVATVIPSRVLDFTCAANVDCWRQFGGVYAPSNTQGWWLNVTVVSPAADGFLIVSGSTSNSTSSVNFQTTLSPIANTVIVRADATGRIRFRSSTAVRILVDMFAYMRPPDPNGTSKLTYYATIARRAYDATVPSGDIDSNMSPPPPLSGATQALVVPTADAVLIGFTGVNQSAWTYYQVRQLNTADPGISNLNLLLGGPANANLALSRATYSGGAYVTHYSYAGTSRRILDTVGYLD